MSEWTRLLLGIVAVAAALGVACSDPVSLDEPVAIERVEDGLRPEVEFILSTYIIVDGDEVDACSTILESNPPQCGGTPGFPGEGIPVNLTFDVHEIPSATTYDRGVVLAGPVELVGRFEGETFVATGWDEPSERPT